MCQVTHTHTYSGRALSLQQTAKEGGGPETSTMPMQSPDEACCKTRYLSYCRTCTWKRLTTVNNFLHSLLTMKQIYRATTHRNSSFFSASSKSCFTNKPGRKKSALTHWKTRQIFVETIVALINPWFQLKQVQVLAGMSLQQNVMRCATLLSSSTGK